MSQANEYDRVRSAVEAYGPDTKEAELRNKLLADGFDPALIARVLSDRKWRSGASRKTRFGTGALVLGYVLYGVFAVGAFAFFLTRPGGAQPPTHGLILGAIVLIAAALLVVVRQPGVALGLVIGFAVMALVSSGSVNLLSDRYEAVERTILLYPLVGAVGALFWTLFRRVP
jgi:hypothetical protein